METWKIKPVFDRKKKATPEKSAKGKQSKIGS